MSWYYFLHATATPEIYTLSLHDALPICPSSAGGARRAAHRVVDDLLLAVDHPLDARVERPILGQCVDHALDRKSTRLNSSHLGISYAVFCLKKKIKHSSATRHEEPTENA